MRRASRMRCAAAVVLGIASASANAAEPGVAAVPETTLAATGFYYAMRDQPDFGVGVVALNHGSLHLEARYNYEARDAASAFVGWKLVGGDAVTFEVTPIVGALFGSARGFVPGLEASIGYDSLDAYIEAEYVRDLEQSSASYFYAWSELGWTPAQWLRVGLVGQRTRIVNNGRDLQRGAFLQLRGGKATLAIYAFNPDSAERYIIISLGAQF
jgi:hypothetical protein